MADTRTTTPAPVTRRRADLPDVTTPRVPFPSIFELGQRIAAADKEHHRLNLEQIDNAGTYSIVQRAEAGMSLCLEHVEALQELVCTMPAVSLADAAVQIVVAAALTTNIQGEGDLEAIAQTARKLERVMVSLLPVVASAAGLDMEAMDFGQFTTLHASRFYGMERLA